MKRNAKIIQISGFRGILTAMFIVVCLAAGFVAFPGLVAMNIWNYFAGVNVPEINLYQGVLLWAIIALICFIANKQKAAVTIGFPRQLSEEEVNALMERIKSESKRAKVILKEIEEAKKEIIESNENASDKETITK